MKKETGFLTLQARERGLASLFRLCLLTGGFTLALAGVLALTGSPSAPAAGINSNSVQHTFTPLTELVSVNQFGTDSGNNNSAGALQEDLAISADGRFVAFSSRAGDLVANDPDLYFGNASDVFVRDLQTGVTTLASVNRFGTSSGNGHSSGIALSADGRFVAFSSLATDLVENDTNETGDVFVRDLRRRTTTLVSVNRFGTNGGNDRSGYNPLSISADGRFVLFASLASDLVETLTNGGLSLFVRDLQKETTTLVTSASFLIVAFSADGRFVAFGSEPTGTSLGPWDVFVRDVKQGTTTLVSVNRFGNRGNGNNSFPGNFSADSRFLAFTSDASDLVAIDDTNGVPNSNGDDVFVRDLKKGVTMLASVNRFGTSSANADSGAPVLSADGRFVVFGSSASDLVESDTNGSSDVFVRDLHKGTTTMVSVNVTGTNGGNRWSGIVGLSGSPLGVISADDRFVAFSSWSSDLVDNDSNYVPPGPGHFDPPPLGQDVFVRDLHTGTTTMVSVNFAGTNGGNRNARSPVLSADGRFVAFVSDSSDLVANDTNGEFDVFVRPVVTPRH